MAGSPQERGGVEYIPLIGDAASDDGNASTEHINIEEKDSIPQRPTGKRRTVFSTLVTSALVVSILSFALSGAQLSSVIRYTHTGPTVDVSALRRPSLYQGLERVPEIKAAMAKEKPMVHMSPPLPSSTSTSAAPASTASGSTSRPSTIARVDSLHPQTSYPNDGWVLLTDTDRTVMQFLAPSVASSCTFKGFWPARRALGDKMLTLEGADSSVRVSLRLLPPEFSMRNVTWDALPPKDDHLGSLTASFGTDDAGKSLFSFPCEAGERYVVELACIGEGCRVEYKDADGLPTLGIQLAVLA
ncbi:hypothetical protein PLICRDRAFT_173429 [Plicaturopsis crispa FD-325 SS-3]|nr:hypothetical protein PLICRDRAFT_173429 [Plicaturopsis crispa FD-325 SS-3]